MGKWLLCMALLLALLGCSKKADLTGEQPPKTSVQIGNHKYPTTLGSYCWSANGQGRCVDAVGPAELLKDKKPILVHAKDEIALVMDYEPKPNMFQVMQTNEAGQREVPLKDNRFAAPVQKGTYYYSYSVSWMDERVAHLSHGSAVYYFVLEVN